MTLKAVILNDTRGDNHFGCFRVMRMIEQNLRQRDIHVLARSLVRNDWERDRPFLRAMAESDIIVINGEGTLHHGAKGGEKLLRVADHPARGQKPVALINTLYQENPAFWARYLERIDLISTRDSWSAAAASAHAGRTIGFVPDLSLSDGFAEPRAGVSRDLLLVGDSVSRKISRELLEIAASRPDARLLPITRTIKSSKPHYPAPLRALREVYARLHARMFQLRHPHVWFNKNEQDFIDALQHGLLHVTGRFHSVCFCIFSGTPFLALDSNSWKIEALLNDLDLGTHRLTTIEGLRERLSDPEAFAYSPQEQEKTSIAIDRCGRDAALLFDRIRGLAATGR